MASGQVQVRLCVRMAWWWRWLYVPAFWCAAVLGIPPNWDSFRRVTFSAMRVRIAP